jgi:hypothetical protein
VRQRYGRHQVRLICGEPRQLTLSMTAPAKVKLYINNSKDIWFKPMPYKDTFFVKMHGDPRLWAEHG